MVIIFPVETAPTEQGGAGQLSLGLRVDGGPRIDDGSLDPRALVSPSQSGIMCSHVSHSNLLFAGVRPSSLLSFLPGLDFLTDRPLNVVVAALLHLPHHVRLLHHSAVRVARLAGFPVPAEQS